MSTSKPELQFSSIFHFMRPCNMNDTMEIFMDRVPKYEGHEIKVFKHWKTSKVPLSSSIKAQVP